MSPTRRQLLAGLFGGAVASMAQFPADAAESTSESAPTVYQPCDIMLFVAPPVPVNGEYGTYGGAFRLRADGSLMWAEGGGLLSAGDVERGPLHEIVSGGELVSIPELISRVADARDQVVPLDKRNGVPSWRP